MVAEHMLDVHPLQLLSWSVITSGLLLVQELNSGGGMEIPGVKATALALLFMLSTMTPLTGIICRLELYCGMPIRLSRVPLPNSVLT